MVDHDYTPEQALKTLLRKVRERDEILAERIRISIDAGKDIRQTEPPSGRRQRVIRTYRQKVPYSHEEALAVALDVLQSHFIELPMFINSAAADFEEASVGVPADTRRGQISIRHEAEALTLKDQGEPKQLQIELQTETQLSNTNEDIFNLEPSPEGLIEEERANLVRLKDLTTF
jgi:hypothetical protein